jgi:hypothetical protein
MSRTSSAKQRAAARVFVSYTHDSPEHEERVLALANRLVAEGVDAHLDAYEESPPEGWPAWMSRQVRESDFVLVVCTPAYNRRLTGRERAGVGLGARWEGGLITQEMYEGGGRNTKFVPVVFSPRDVAEIPDFLKGATRYDLSTEDGYQQLYRRLTGQPSVQKPTLGAVRPMASRTAEAAPSRPSRATPNVSTSPRRKKPTPGVGTAAVGGEVNARGSEELLLIQAHNGQRRFFPIVTLEAHQNISAVVTADIPAGRVLLEELRQHRWGSPTVDIAFGLTSATVRVEQVTRVLEGSAERYSLMFVPDRDSANRGLHEMATNTHTTDRIAELRARRILLDEQRAASASEGGYGLGRDGTLEWLIAGSDRTFKVECSPLPALYRELNGVSGRRFESAARLVSTLWLRVTGTVQHVLELDMRLRRGPALAVSFVGQRPRFYTNQDPAEIRVVGRCLLANPSPSLEVE